MVHLRVERFNDHGRHPNKFISFIKEYRRTTSPAEQARALSVLNRVAAMVYPIMKENGLQVTTLEEHPFNDSYAGINYDAGDCIGLVLRSAFGGWVPENFVLSVMLHELSHVTNMHHAGPFWKTLGAYRGRMAQLTQSGYTGEGFWRNGTVLGTGSATSLAAEAAELPKTLCGGAFKGSPFFRKRRRRKGGTAGVRAKKVKPGEKLGGDVELRKRLDGGKSKATPRVVKSKRGQELRASAAELRFSQQLTKQFSPAKEEEDVEEDDTDEYEDEREYKPDWKVEDEDLSVQSLLKDEMHEEWRRMRQSTLDFKPVVPTTEVSAVPSTAARTKEIKKENRDEGITLIDSDDDTTDGASQTRGENQESTMIVDTPDRRTVDGEPSFPDGSVCRICTACSDPSATFCEGCGTMRSLEPGLSWRCGSLDCRTVGYRNHVDSNVCGLCASRREK